MKSLREIAIENPNATPTEIAKKYNLSTVVNRTAWVNERTLFALFPVAEADEILRNLEAAARVNSVLERYRSWLKPSESGIDVGEERVREQILDLVDSKILTLAQAAILLEHGTTRLAPEVTVADVELVIAENALIAERESAMKIAANEHHRRCLEIETNFRDRLSALRK